MSNLEELRLIEEEIKLSKANWVALKDKRTELYRQLLFEHLAGSDGWSILRYMPASRSVVFTNSFSVSEGLKCFDIKHYGVSIKAVVHNQKDVEVTVGGSVKAVGKFFRDFGWSVNKETLQNSVKDFRILLDWR